jgi:hypothetical protein
MTELSGVFSLLDAAQGRLREASVAGKIKRLIDELIELRSGGNETLGYFVRAHLAMKGIAVEEYTEMSPDDPEVIAELEQMLSDFRNRKK